MELFSDRENGIKEPNKEIISLSVWNGIVSIFESFVANNALSKDFPELCPDNLGVIGFDSRNFNNKLKAIIPAFDFPVRFKREQTISDFDFSGEPTKVTNTSIDTLSTLDFLEFCHYHLYDAVPVGKYHDYFNHFHLSFPSRHESQNKFREEINYLFQRNEVAFQLDKDGRIKRILSNAFENVVKRRFNTTDSILNNLLLEASESIYLPKLSQRQHALEKLWDGFERTKTYYSTNKKISAEQLLKEVSSGNVEFETIINTESKHLTDIGNKFHIRHFETDKVPILEPSHIDYLFYRMYSLIDLMMSTLEP